MKQSDLKHVEDAKLGSKLERDAEGRLFSPRIRELFSPLKVDHEVLEALAALRLAARSIGLLQERWAEKHGLSEGRLAVLFRLYRGGEIPLGDLAHNLDSSPRNITGLVDHLERDGLVERVPDPEDRRSVRARLTESGRSRIEPPSRRFRPRQPPLPAKGGPKTRASKFMPTGLESPPQRWRGRPAAIVRASERDHKGRPDGELRGSDLDMSRLRPRIPVHGG